MHLYEVNCISNHVFPDVIGIYIVKLGYYVLRDEVKNLVCLN